ncbi:type IV secretion system protein PtlF [Bordetella bronchiseptica]|uniref:type IV secretion system protein PtlF n=1 Tax=Bordetella bronchiseptica TaxID=518 RepID=UPI0004615C0A|nr:type IV secretion system protein PtlF [Bordetella bronchiseptica]KDC46261.1 P-type conjugative transfer protein VirB9 [Bordetella bronchiseptica M85/00/2]
MMAARMMAAGLAATALSAHAFRIPTPGEQDARIQTVPYHPEEVVLVRAWNGYVTRIVFDEQEKIIDVAAGFADGWQFSPEGNVLYIKAKSFPAQGSPAQVPEPGLWNTNLLVKTDRRLYDFDLVLASADAATPQALQRSRMAYRLQFRYPAAPQAASRASPVGPAVPAGALNRRYAMQVGNGSDGIAPIAAYDDGRHTWLTFRPGQPFPAVFAVAPDGTETLVNLHIDNQSLVIHRVAPVLMLRSGASVIRIVNQNGDASASPAFECHAEPAL